MIHLIYERATGNVVGHVEADAAPVVLDHHATIVAASVPVYADVRVEAGVLVEVPRPIAELRERRWAAVRAARDAARFGGCETPFGRVDTTVESLVLANGAASTAMTAAQMGEPFLIGWTMADNTTVPLDGPQMIALGVAMSRHVGACHAIGAERRAAIEAAQDAAAVAAVPVHEGWPDAAA